MEIVFTFLGLLAALGAALALWVFVTLRRERRRQEATRERLREQFGQHFKVDD